MWPFRRKKKKRVESSKTTEQRRFLRVEPFFDVKVKIIDRGTMGTQFVRTVSCLDLNEKGMRFRDASAYPVGALCDLWLQASKSDSVELQGEVLRCKKLSEPVGQSDVFIGFKGLSEEQESKVCRLISLISTWQGKDLV